MPGLAASDLPVIKIGDTITPESLEALRAACLQHGMGASVFCSFSTGPMHLAADQPSIALCQASSSWQMPSLAVDTTLRLKR